MRKDLPAQPLQLEIASTTPQRYKAVAQGTVCKKKRSIAAPEIRLVFAHPRLFFSLDQDQKEL